MRISREKRRANEKKRAERKTQRGYRAGATINGVGKRERSVGTGWKS